MRRPLALRALAFYVQTPFWLGVAAWRVFTRETLPRRLSACRRRW